MEELFSSLWGVMMLAAMFLAPIGAFLYIKKVAETLKDPKYCSLCKRNVVPEKPFNWLVFIFLCGCCYIPIWLSKDLKCPICGSTALTEPRSDEVSAAVPRP